MISRLKYCWWLGVVAAWSAGRAAADDSCVVTLRNGDELTGRIVEVDGNAIRLESTVFSEPTTIASEQLASVRAGAAPGAEAAPWAIRLQSGSLITGRIVELTAGELQIDSPRFGPLRIARAAVVEVERWDHANSLVTPDLSAWRFDVPKRASGLGAVVAQAPAEPKEPVDAERMAWSFDEHGRLATLTAGATAFRSAHLGPKGELDLKVSAEGHFEFWLGFGPDREAAPYLTYADGTLMVMTADGIEFVELGAAAKQSLALRISWDASAKKLWLTTPRGEQLLQVAFAGFGDDAGLHFQNQGDDLRLDHAVLHASPTLRVDSTTAAEPKDTDSDDDVLLRADGTRQPGRAASFHNGSWEFRSSPGNEVLEIAENDLGRLTLASETQADGNAPGKGSLLYSDGQRIAGQRISLEDGTAVLDSFEWGSALRIPLSQWELATWTAPAAGEKASRFVSGRTELSGVFAWGDGSAPLRWQLAENSETAPIDVTRRVVVTLPRTSSSGASYGSASDRIYLSNGDVVPGQVTEMSNDRVTLTTSFSGAHDLAAATVSAIDFGVVPSRKRPRFTQESRTRLLELPRYAKETPFTHVLIGRNGDLLRGRLERLGPKVIEWDSRMDPLLVSRKNVAALVALPADDGNRQNDDRNKPNTNAQTVDDSASLLTLLLRDGYALSGTLTVAERDVVKVDSPLLGECAVPNDAIESIHVNDPSATRELDLYRDWAMTGISEPRWKDEEAAPGDANALIKTIPDDFTARTLDGGEFTLSEFRGQPVILIFWTSWSTPCRRAIDDLLAELKSLATGDVVIVGVNQGETSSQLKKFVPEQDWGRLNIVLDVEGDISKKFHVATVPQIVVLDSNGAVQDVFVGYSPAHAKALRGGLQKKAAASQP